MAMNVLVFAHQKGGVGKSTLAAHLGVMAEKMGAGPVALLDTDPQASIADWWNARQAETPLFALVEMADIKAKLQALEEAGVKLAIIDTPGHFNGLPAVLEYADLVLVPTRPSPLDLRAVGPTIRLIEQAKKKMVFIINSTKPRARLTSMTAITLSQHGTVAPVQIGDRQDFALSMIDGSTAQEDDPSGKSHEEIAQLCKYIQLHLRK